MDFCLNKTEIETKNIHLSFEKIKSFNELLECNLFNVIYMEDSSDEYPKVFITGQTIARKKRFFGKTIYFKLNNSVFEATEIDRANFGSCGYIFYKMSHKLNKCNSADLHELNSIGGKGK